jgi:hypothetical protein
MFLKKKNIPVIFYSSVIIIAVLVANIALYIVYFEWKNKRAIDVYERSIYALTAGLFKGEVDVLNLDLIPLGGGSGPEMAVVEGTIINKSSKTISSILLEISFVAGDGSVRYTHRFHPFGKGPGEKDLGSPTLYPLAGTTRNMLLPGDRVTFRHILRNCPADIPAGTVRTGRNFAVRRRSNDLKLIHSLEGLSVK